MGCGISSEVNQRFEKLRASREFVEWNATFTALQLSPADVKRLFVVFCRADMDGGGTIELLELLMVLDVERTPFMERIFSIFDEDASGKIDFGEFVLSLWNYCTLSKFTLSTFAFDLYDRNSSGVLEEKDLEMMLADLYGKDYKNNVYAKQILQELGEEQEGSDERNMDLDEFIKFTATHQSLLFPAFQVQLLLRKNVMGMSFWEKHSQRRLKLSNNKYVKLRDFLSVVMVHRKSDLNGLLASSSSNSLLDRLGSKGERNARYANSDGLDFNAPNAAVIPLHKSSSTHSDSGASVGSTGAGGGSGGKGARRKQSKDFSQAKQRRQSKDFGAQGGGAHANIFVSPRADTSQAAPRRRGSEFVSPRLISTVNDMASPRTGSAANDLISPRQRRGSAFLGGTDMVSPKRRGSEFVSPRVPNAANDLISPRQRRMSEFVSPRGPGSALEMLNSRDAKTIDSATSSAMQELNDLIAQHSTVPSSKAQRKKSSMGATLQMKVAAIHPDDLLQREGGNPFEATVESRSGVKNRKGSGW